MSAPSGPPSPAVRIARRNARLFVAFRILFNVRFYYPVFMVMFLDFGITMEQFGLLNAAWAAAIVALEVPSGALADLVGRRRLLVAAALLMVVEMLLLCLVEVPSAWVFPVLLVNRIASGAAEAFASGADEALAYDSLAAAGLEGEWPRVLERLMQAGGVVACASMIAGGLLYDPWPLTALAGACGLPLVLTAADTFRLPVWCTLGSAVAAVGVTLAMREPHRRGSGTPVGLVAPFRETLATGAWIIANPLVLTVIAAGVLCDQPIRQLLVVSSEIYREIGIPEPAFGLVGAGSAAIGLFVAGPIRRLASRASPRRSFQVVAGITLVGLAGTACFVPLWGVAFIMLLSLTMRIVVYLQSHYLNQLVGSDRRATVLSFRGLAVNVSYGLMSAGFAAAVAVAEAAGVAGHLGQDGPSGHLGQDGPSGHLGQDGPSGHLGPAFRVVVGLLPGYFLVLCGLFAAALFWARATRARCDRPGGFATEQDVRPSSGAGPVQQ